MFVPFGLHGDGGQFQRNDSINAISFRTLLSSWNVATSQLLLIALPKGCINKARMMIQKTPCIIFGRCWLGAWKQLSTTSSQRWTTWARIGPLAPGGPRWQGVLSAQLGIEDSSMPSRLMVTTWPINSTSMVQAWSKRAGIVIPTNQATPTMISDPLLPEGNSCGPQGHITN